MLQVYSSNHVETLSKRLGNVLAQPLPNPFTQETILIHSHGIERWLSLHLADQLGICANVEFLFPVPFLTEWMISNVPSWDTVLAKGWEPEALQWTLMEVLPKVAQQAGGEALAAYLENDRPLAQVRLYQLAHQLAFLLDRYQLYRPEWLKRWELGRELPEESWQAPLWRTLTATLGEHHRLALRDQFLKRLHRETPRHLPPRLSVFGISSLAPFFIEVLAAMGRFTDVHLFFLNPCQEYWGDILSKKQRSRLSRKHQSNSAAVDQLELGLSAEPDFENELLAYFGKLGRDFFDLLLDQENTSHHEHFVEPDGNTALRALQQDILHLDQGHARDHFNQEHEADAKSLQVHSCHSRMREVEVLNDLLLDLFEKNKDLQPRDVVVMAPDIEPYIPKIHAVFGRAKDDERHLPYDIGDRTAKRAHTLGSIILRLLEFPNHRWETSTVLTLLEAEPVMRRFGLADQDLETIRHWVEQNKICWAKDGSTKEQHHLPSTHENTWQFGIDRLVLGHALPLADRQHFGEILPYDHLEGDALATLSNFLRFWEQLSAAATTLRKPHTLHEWADIGRQLIANFIEDAPQFDRELQLLYQMFDELQENAESSPLDEPLTHDVICDHLQNRLERSQSIGGFFTGGITFCNLLPMRSLPFRVVVLLGMASHEFPRAERQLAFDLTHLQPRRGDRTRRFEDRYMFLEALLATRDHFIVLYTGQSSKDNSVISPSAFVTQVQQYLETVYNWPPSRYTTHHRLQPFSANYFDGGTQWFSYAREYLQKPPTPQESPTPSNESIALEPVVHLDDLIAFYRHPIAAFYQSQFNLHQPRTGRELSDTEPIDLNALESWQIEQWILELIEHGFRPSRVRELLRYSGLLPHGNHGLATAEHLQMGVERFVEHIREFLANQPRTPIEIDLTFGERRLVGRLDHLYPHGLRHLRFGRIRPPDQLRLWIEHLVIQTVSNNGTRQASAYLGRGGQTWCYQEFNTSQAAIHELKQLIAYRDLGLRKPLPLFPRTSMVYALAQKRRQGFGESKRKAYDAWRGNGFAMAEADDYYHRLAYANHPNPLDQDFCNLSDKLVRPLLDNAISYADV